jgi:hypothetical protein
VFLTALVGGCSGGGSAGSGKVQTQTRNVQGFDSVEFSGAGTLSIQQTGTDSLKIQADDNILPALTSDLAGTTLRLGVRPGTNIGRATNIRYVVTVKHLGGIILSGAGDVKATDVNGPHLSIANSGAGRITVSGRADDQVVELSGTGEYDGANLASQDADVSVSGTGTAVVNASRTLNAHVTGVGSVEYLSNPQVTKDITGIGTVHKRS